MIDKEEIVEAVSAADVVLEKLHEALGYLDSASKWGIADLAGGGFIVSLAKQDKIKKANDKLNEAKKAYRVFRDELKDVKISIGQAEGFMDVFVDNILVDAIVQSEIDSNKKKIHQLMDRVRKVRSDLLDQLYED